MISSRLSYVARAAFPFVLVAGKSVALTISVVDGLTFPRGFPGDGNVTVAANNVNAATLLLSGGNANRRVNLDLPNNTPLTFGTTSFNANNFTQTPTNIRLNAAGQATFSLGGRRQAIPASAAAGTYLGSLVVTAEEQGGGGGTAAASVTVTAPVWRPLSANKLRDLDFGLGMVGDGPKVVAASAGTAAQIEILGQPFSTFSTSVPTSITMNCTGCGGSAAQRRLVATLTSPGVQTLDGSGALLLTVGGTREAITTGKRQGTYSAAFTVTVTYN